MFDIKFTESAKQDLRYFSKAEQTGILGEIERQLRYEPMVETKKRKELRQTDIGSYELRLGDTRVFYNVYEAEDVVDVVAVGWKEHNELFIRGKKVSI